MLKRTELQLEHLHDELLKTEKLKAAAIARKRYDKLKNLQTHLVSNFSDAERIFRNAHPDDEDYSPTESMFNSPSSTKSSEINFQSFHQKTLTNDTESLKESERFSSLATSDDEYEENLSTNISERNSPKSSFRPHLFNRIGKTEEF